MNKKAVVKSDNILDFEIFQFPDTGYITEFAYLLIEILFDITEVFLTNLSEFSDFEFWKDIPGHEYRDYLEIPEEERKKFYPEYENCSPSKLEILRVRYPPITKEDWIKINKQTRSRHIKLIESKFKISMDDYPANEKLLVWKVAIYVQYKLKLKEASKYCF
jgi:hypothetical protein